MSNNGEILNQTQSAAGELSQAIRAGLEKAGIDSKTLVDRLRLSPDTVTCFLEGRELSFMPTIYVHGYLTQIAECLELDSVELCELYDKAFPPRDSTEDLMELPQLPFKRALLTAGVAGVGLLAVLVAVFAS